MQIQQLAWQLVHRLDQVFPDVTKSDVVDLSKQYMKHKRIYKDITVKQKNKYTYLQDVQSILNVPLYTKFHFRDSKIKSQYVDMQYGLCGSPTCQPSDALGEVLEHVPRLSCSNSKTFIEVNMHYCMN